jgi:hypothetical protein
METSGFEEWLKENRHAGWVRLWPGTWVRVSRERRGMALTEVKSLLARVAVPASLFF